MDALAHRGPDGRGQHIDPVMALGHRRLSIIDIEGGVQPMSDATGRYTLVFNGEVYNYVELRRELVSQGLHFRTRSDTEVLLGALLHWGRDALERLDGMYAFALWDAHQRRLLLGRDRIGIKPLYYAPLGAGLAFASELKALLALPALPRRLDVLSVSKYFTFGYVPAPASIYEDVRKLEPGHWLTWDGQEVETGSYWDLPLTDHPVASANVDECATRLLSLLKDSVHRQLRSDVPVGVFLSGGIDSSTITALAADQLLTPGGRGHGHKGELHSFSIGFDHRSYDESPYARQVAGLLGTQHHHQVLSVQNAMAVFAQVMRVADEPLADASILPTYLLCRLAAQHVKVVLGGDGGDELFAGYPSFQAHRAVQALSFLPTSWRDRFARLARASVPHVGLPVSHRYASLGFLAGQFVKGLGLSPEARFMLWMGFANNAEKEELFSADLKQRLLRSDAFEDVVRLVRQSHLHRDLARLLYLCTKMYFQDGILVKVDRASMAHGLEVRVPFMDRDVVEYASRIQPFYKLHGLTTKYVLKHAVRRLLPANIIHRRKAGFMMPVAVWLETDMRAVVEDLCSERELAQTGLFNPTYVRRLLNEHFERKRDHRKRIWPILCFMAWRRNYGWTD